MPLLEIEDLRLEFQSNESTVRALDGVSLTLDRGETLCVVGESGCGKSVTALSISRLLPSPPARYLSGRVLVNGRDVLKMDSREIRKIRGGCVSYIFQEPGVSLNPVYRIGTQIKEALRFHAPERATDEEVVQLLRDVKIPAADLRYRDYPWQLSGGMQQRVMIAMALASEPQLLVADEPTTALDVTIQAQILELLRELQQRQKMAILLITHNLGIVGDMGGRVAVMYAGHIVEQAQATELLRRPLHPYTRALINSVPKLDNYAARLTPIGGTVPPPGLNFPGCRFASRCPIAREDCRAAVPALTEIESGHWVRCPYSGVPERKN